MKSPGDAASAGFKLIAVKHNLNFSASLHLAEFLSWLRVSDLAWHRRLRTQGAPFSRKTPRCSKLAGKLPVLKRGCLPEEHNKGRSDCKAGTGRQSCRQRGLLLDTGWSITCKMKVVRMLLAWMQTFLLSNMLLAEVYGSGGKITIFPFCSNLRKQKGESSPFPKHGQAPQEDDRKRSF